MFALWPFAPASATAQASTQASAEASIRATAQTTVGPAQDLDSSITIAFQETHQGYSVDELLIRDDLRNAFVAAIQQQHSTLSETEINHRLLRLRKAGKLAIQVVQRGTPPNPSVRFATEIAARLVSDSNNATLDEILCDPALRTKLLREAQRTKPDALPYDIYKTVLNLRKSRRLKPELVLKVADWNRQISVWNLDEIEDQWNEVPTSPGIYLFRNNDGYLYIGESQNLRERLKQHLIDSDREGLANFLRSSSTQDLSIETHAFDPLSPAKKATMRRAYESELIRSRNPKLNVRP